MIELLLILYLLYLYAWGVLLIHDLYRPSRDQLIGLFVWPILPAIWAPQIVWERWGRRIWRRLRGR